MDLIVDTSNLSYRIPCEDFCATAFIIRMVVALRPEQASLSQNTELVKQSKNVHILDLLGCGPKCLLHTKGVFSKRPVSSQALGAGDPSAHSVQSNSPQSRELIRSFSDRAGHLLNERP